jgi:hypothetical protein
MAPAEPKTKPEPAPEVCTTVAHIQLEWPAGRPERRSLYVLARRNYHLSMLDVFDQPIEVID